MMKTIEGATHRRNKPKNGVELFKLADNRVYQWEHGAWQFVHLAPRSLDNRKRFTKL